MGTYQPHLGVNYINKITQQKPLRICCYSLLCGFQPTTSDIFTRDFTSIFHNAFLSYILKFVLIYIISMKAWPSLTPIVN